MFSSPCTTGGLRWVGDHLWVSQSAPCTQTSQCADLESCSEWHQPAQGWGLTSEKNPIFWWGELILVRSTCSSAQGKASWCDGCVMQILQCSFLQPTCCLHLLMYFLQPWSWRESSFETNILFYKHSREWKKKQHSFVQVQINYDLSSWKSCFSCSGYPECEIKEQFLVLVLFPPLASHRVCDAEQHFLCEAADIFCFIGL